MLPNCQFPECQRSHCCHGLDGKKKVDEDSLPSWLAKARPIGRVVWMAARYGAMKQIKGTVCYWRLTHPFDSLLAGVPKKGMSCWGSVLESRHLYPCLHPYQTLAYSCTHFFSWVLSKFEVTKTDRKCKGCSLITKSQAIMKHFIQCTCGEKQWK